MKPTRTLPLAVLALGSLLATGCRDSSGSAATGGSQALLPSASGTDGCNGAAQTFTPGQTPTAIALSTWTGDAFSQATAARGGEVLYLTGAGATVVEVDLTGGGIPAETALVGAGVVQALVDPLSLGAAPVLSGLCVLDDDHLLVMEHTYNVLLLVSRTTPDDVVLFAGVPNTTPGLADGPASLARFSFEAPARVVATADGQVLVADSGNHVIRRLRDDVAATLVGGGVAFHNDGDLFGAYFDTPSGLAVTCSGRLLVSETGASLAGGHRLREVELGAETFFGQLGSVVTLVGDGTDATVGGPGIAATVDAPVGVVTTSTGEAYWVDAGTGILRRWDPTSDLVDCPLWTDCGAAVTGGGNFTVDGTHSLVSTDGGVLYALDAGAGQLWRVTP